MTPEWIPMEIPKKSDPIKMEWLWRSLDLSEESGKLYKKFPCLKDYKELLWNIRNKDILGNGDNAIIVKHPNKDAVIKIAFSDKVDDLMIEYKAHDLFYKTLRSWKTSWEVPNNIRIPEVRMWSDDTKWTIIMEKIKWQSIISKSLRNDFEWRLKNEPTKYLDSLTDYQLKELLLNKYNVWETFLKMKIDWAWFELRKLLQDKSNWLEKALTYLKKQWLSHKDFHAWNVMIDNNWNIYLIDFGRTSLNK